MIRHNLTYRQTSSFLKYPCAKQGLSYNAHKQFVYFKLINITWYVYSWQTHIHVVLRTSYQCSVRNLKCYIAFKADGWCCSHRNITCYLAQISYICEINAHFQFYVIHQHLSAVAHFEATKLPITLYFLALYTQSIGLLYQFFRTQLCHQNI